MVSRSIGRDVGHTILVFKDPGWEIRWTTCHTNALLELC